MSDLSSKFTREEIQILIDAVNDWENLGMGEWHMAKAFKDAPMPPEDHEMFEIMKSAKEHFRNREMIINDNREVRMEQAVFLKAKLFMVRKNLNIDSLFEMPVDTSSPPPAPKSVPVAKVAPVVEKVEESTAVEALKLAEFFIKDLGVWGHYEKFLKERSDSAEKTANS